MSSSPRFFPKETLIKGRPVQLDCAEIAGQVYSIAPGPLKIASLYDEWYEDVSDPVTVIQTMKGSPEFRPDIFTFWQRVPDVEPQFPYYFEREEIAVLPIASYNDWWNKQIKSRTRGLIRKTEKEGVVVRETTFDDDFVRGMTAIFNESPVRQGRHFWHYGKDAATVKRQFSRYLYREYIIGAYCGDEMIGFIMLGNAGRYGVLGQIISSLHHRDKATNNALIAKAVQVCERVRLPRLVYLFWNDNSLSEFKRRCGFEQTLIPRYYVPLTAKGSLALRLGAHRGWRGMVPAGMKVPLKRLKTSWYALRDARGPKTEAGESGSQES
jgi:hypothetical protein